MRFYSVVVIGLFAVTSVVSAGNFADSWSGWGGGIYNNRFAASNSFFNSTSVQGLRQHCQISYDQGVSATPTLDRHDRVAYYPTWSGLLVALDYTTCKTKWTVNVTTIVTSYSTISPVQTAILNAVSRTSPQVDEKNDLIYFGTQLLALIIAVDRSSGATLGVTQLNPHPVACITQSPTLFDGTLFVGASSVEEAAAAFVPTYPCCSFVGNMVALTYDRPSSQFNVLWNVTMIPETIAGVGNWSGAAIWGSQPSINPESGQVFIATGNTYEVPESYQQCQNTTLNVNSTTDTCLPKEIWQESVLAIDIDSGHVDWVRQLTPLDAWTIACGTVGTPPINAANCPQTPGPDADFGIAPTFVSGGYGAETPHGKDVVVVGQKNGILYALSASSGSTLWVTATSPGGYGGGLSWGVAVDRKRVYFNAINSNGVTWELRPSNLTINGSAYGAASLLDGSLVWETAAQGPGVAVGPPSAVNNIMLTNAPATLTDNGLTPSVQPGGLVILEDSTGKIIKTVILDAASHGGVAIQDRYLLFGTGYNGYNSSGSLYVMTV